jgi:hypothetical protein
MNPVLFGTWHRACNIPFMQDAADKNIFLEITNSAVAGASQ